MRELSTNPPRELSKARQGSELSSFDPIPVWDEFPPYDATEDPLFEFTGAVSHQRPSAAGRRQATEQEYGPELAASEWGS